MNPLGVLILLVGIVLLYLGITGKYKSPAVRQVVTGTPSK